MKRPKEPRKPIEPTEPCEFFDRAIYISPRYNETWTIKELEENLPKDKTLNDLKFSSDEDSYGSTTHTSIFLLTKEKHPHYKSLMTHYNKALKKYKKDILSYDVEYKKYLEYKKIYDDDFKSGEVKRLKKRLAELEK